MTEKNIFLPPANVVYEGYVFTPVCDSVHRWGRAWLLWGACVVAPGGEGACVVALGGVHGYSWGGGVCGIRLDTEIRSMSGRYASYWNAFLLTRRSPTNISNFRCERLQIQIC